MRHNQSMDSRILHIAFTKALSSVAWDRHGEHEYVIVGDGISIDLKKLQGLINATFLTQSLWLSIIRHSAESIPRVDAAKEIAQRLQSRQTVTASDEDVHTFIQVLYMGIARTGVARSNYAFKRTGFARHLI